MVDERLNGLCGLSVALQRRQMIATKYDLAGTVVKCAEFRLQLFEFFQRQIGFELDIERECEVGEVAHFFTRNAHCVNVVIGTVGMNIPHAFAQLFLLLRPFFCRYRVYIFQSELGRVLSAFDQSRERGLLERAILVTFQPNREPFKRLVALKLHLWAQGI